MCSSAGRLWSGSFTHSGRGVVGFDRLIKGFRTYCYMDHKSNLFTEAQLDNRRRSKKMSNLGARAPTVRHRASVDPRGMRISSPMRQVAKSKLEQASSSTKDVNARKQKASRTHDTECAKHGRTPRRVPRDFQSGH